MKKVQNLIHTLIKKSCFPALCVIVSSISDIHEIGVTNSMLFAKLTNAVMDNIFCTIWRSYYKCVFHFTGTYVRAGFRASLCANMRKTGFFSGFSALLPTFSSFTYFLSCFVRGFCSCPSGTYLSFVLIAKCPTDLGTAHFLKSFSAMFFTLARFAVFASGFFALHSSAMDNTQLLSCSFGNFSAKSRSRNFGNIKAFFAKGLELVKPVLFTLNQKGGKDQFKHFKGEGLFTILIPGSLQMGISMVIAEKMPEVVVVAIAQIVSAANIKSFVRSADNAVNAGCGGDIIRHLLTPLVSTLTLWVLPGSQGNSFSQGVITPLLGNSSIIARQAASCLALREVA